MFKIVKREEMSQGTVVLNEIAAPLIARKAKPGQFVILKANETGERIPLTMAYTDPEKGVIAVIYQVVGKSTALFKTLKVGEGYQDVIGPLGKATHIEKLGKVVCVGGGTGVAVLHPITRGMKEAGNHVTAIIGARTKDLLILEDFMRAASNDLHVCTDDGSYGRHGFVTHALKDILDKEKINLVVAIGPVPMMKFVSKLTKEYNVPTMVSLNPIMVDGTGMRRLPCRSAADPVRVRDGPVRRPQGGFRRAHAAAAGLLRRRKDLPQRILCNGRGVAQVTGHR
jgi:ferredoxin--NADP+ reductase